VYNSTSDDAADSPLEKRDFIKYFGNNSSPANSFERIRRDSYCNSIRQFYAVRCFLRDQRAQRIVIPEITQNVTLNDLGLRPIRRNADNGWLLARTQILAVIKHCQRRSDARCCRILASPSADARPELANPALGRVTIGDLAEQHQFVWRQRVRKRSLNNTPPARPGRTSETGRPAHRPATSPPRGTRPGLARAG
jgi:hypothetical protein